MSTWLELKQQGNACFGARNYTEAVTKYKAALSCMSEENGHRKEDMALLYSNRAMANLKLQAFGEAYTDANTAFTLNPELEKARFRRAQALLGLTRLQEAASDFEALVSAQEAPTRRGARKALDETRALLRQQAQHTGNQPKMAGTELNFTSLTQNPPDNLESKVQVMNEIILSHSQICKVGELWYLIDMNWWQDWIAAVNISTQDHKIGALNNIGLIDMTTAGVRVDLPTPEKDMDLAGKLAEKTEEMNGIDAGVGLRVVAEEFEHTLRYPPLACIYIYIYTYILFVVYTITLLSLSLSL